MTTRYAGCFFFPTRIRRIFTDTGRNPLGWYGERNRVQVEDAAALSGLADARKSGHGHLRSLAAGHRLHHLLHLLELLEHGVDLGRGRATAIGDPEPSRTVDQARIPTLGLGHGADDRLDAPQLAFVDIGLTQLFGHARHHLEQVADRTHLAYLPHLVEEVLERELALAQLLGRDLRLVLIERGLRLLDEREDVAHAEDAARHPIGVERLELLELLAGAHEKDRLPHHLLHRERSTTAGIAVDLGEDDAIESDRVVECGCDVHGFLTGHRVDDEQRVRRLHRVAHMPQLVHELRVDLEPARRVHDHDVLAQARGFVQRTLGDGDRVLRAVVRLRPDRKI